VCPSLRPVLGMWVGCSRPATFGIAQALHIFLVEPIEMTGPLKAAFYDCPAVFIQHTSYQPASHFYHHHVLLHQLHHPTTTSSSHIPSSKSYSLLSVGLVENTKPRHICTTLSHPRHLTALDSGSSHPHWYKTFFVIRDSHQRFPALFHLD
jgi:hypothetical protein